MSIAVIVASPIAGQLIVKHGSRRMTLAGGIADTLAVNLVVLAPHPLVLGPVPAGPGRVQRDDGHVDERPRRRGRAGARPADHVVAARRLVVRRRGGGGPRGRARRARRATRASRWRSPRCSCWAGPLLQHPPRRGLRRRGRGDAAASACPRAASCCSAILCLLTMVTEGAMGDWGGIYLRGDLGASAAIAAVTFSVFSAGMTTGRDRRRLGHRAARPGAHAAGGRAADRRLARRGAADRHAHRRADRAVRGRPRRRQRRAADVQRRRPPARHRRRARDRGGLLDGVVRLPDRAADHRRARRRRLAPVGAVDA